MDKESVIITVLVLVIVVLAGFTYYLYSGRRNVRQWQQIWELNYNNVEQD